MKPLPLPVPSPREVRFSFLVAGICVFVLTSAVVWGIVHKVSQSDGILRIAVANADQVQRLNEQLDAQGTASTRERAALKRQIGAVREELRRQRAAQRALMEYLRNQGISVPQSALTPPSRGGSSPDPKAQTPPGASSPSGPASPAPTPRPTATPSPSPGVLDPACVLLTLPTCPLP